MKKIAFLISVIFIMVAICSCSAPEEDKTAENPKETAQVSSVDEATSSNENTGNTMADAELKDFITATLDGKEFTAEAFAENELTMINIWATWCAPCINELPEIEEIAKKYANEGIKVCGLLFDSEDDGKIGEAKEILKSKGITYTQLQMSDSVRKLLVDEYDVTSLPTTFFVDKNGNVVQTIVGARFYDDWEAIIKEVRG